MALACWMVSITCLLLATYHACVQVACLEARRKPTSRWWSPPFCLSHPSCSFDSLGGGDSIVVPQDGSHGDCPGQVIDLVAGGGNDDPPPSSVILVSPAPLTAVLTKVTVS